MNRLFEESITEPAANECEMLLAVDVQTEEDSYMITASVPGLKADDLNIEILKNTITLRG